MSQDTHSASGTGHPTHSSRWLTLVVALCGALAGGSIVEAIAALASHPSMPVSPDHLVAEPLAIAGALCGGLLAALMVTRDERNGENQAQAASSQNTVLDVSPSEPMPWQPTPHVVAITPPANAPQSSLSRTPLRASRKHRTHTQHITPYRTVRATMPQP